MSRKLFATHGALAAAAAFLAGSTGAALAACAAGDLAGSWKLYGMNANAPGSVGQPHDFTNTGGVTWCSLNLTNASSSPIKYNVSGTCHSRGVTDHNATLTVKAGSSFTETNACGLGGNLEFVGIPFTLTLIDAKIDGLPGTKTRATGVAQAPNTDVRINYTFFNLQR